uniref:Uncharacterized protein n=1 Tax=Acrobeloides nanus TaxID=290746 RepID=A0A914CT27_9BILA
MFLVIFFSIFIQIVARPSKESGFLTFDDAPGQKFTSEEVETIMEFAQRRIAEQLALAATGQNDPSLMESLVRLKEEIVMDKQVPKSIPPVRHLDAVIAKPQNPQFSPDHIHLRRPNYGASQETSRQNGNSRPSHGAYDSGKTPSKPQRQSLSKANSNDPVVSYVRIEPTANKNVQKPPSLTGPLPPMTEAATDLWKGTNLDAKHDFQPKISVQNEGAEQER